MAPWSREELETLDWTYLPEGLAPVEDEGVSENGPTIYDSHLGYQLAWIRPYGEKAAGDLMAAAPELALACLKARERETRLRHLVAIGGVPPALNALAATAGQSLGIATAWDWLRSELSPQGADLLRALDAALALAGVQP